MISFGAISRPELLTAWGGATAGAPERGAYFYASVWLRVAYIALGRLPGWLAWLFCSATLVSSLQKSARGLPVELGGEYSRTWIASSPWEASICGRTYVQYLTFDNRHGAPRSSSEILHNPAIYVPELGKLNPGEEVVEKQAVPLGVAGHWAGVCIIWKFSRLSKRTMIVCVCVSG